MKRCCECKALKPLADFYADRSRPDGLTRRCRACESGAAFCARCGWPIDPGSEWHLDHTDDRTGYLGPSHLVEVFLEVTNTTLEIPRGETPVETLKRELGLAETDPLWVIRKDGKRKPLGDHEHHDVRAGDRYQAILKGGVS